MRVQVLLLSLLLLPAVLGCEGNTPRRSPFAAGSSPSAAEPVKYAPFVKGATATPRPGGQANPNPQPAVEAPANNEPITINGDKLETRRQLLNYHTAVFLKEEVNSLTTTGVTENNNFVFRPSEGLDKINIVKVVDLYRAEKGKTPQTVQQFLALLQENGIDLAQLQPTEFYVYDPVLAGKEEAKANLDYLQQYP